MSSTSSQQSPCRNCPKWNVEGWPACIDSCEKLAVFREWPTLPTSKDAGYGVPKDLVGRVEQVCGDPYYSLKGTEVLYKPSFDVPGS